MNVHPDAVFLKNMFNAWTEENYHEGSDGGFELI